MDALSNASNDFSMLQAQNTMLRAETNAATLAKAGKSHAAIKKVAETFEGMFLTAMLQNIFDHIPTDGPMGGGSSEKIWRSMQVQEYGSNIAQNGGIGIAEAVERQLLNLQEV